MSIVIVGGHDRMVGQYKKICKSYNLFRMRSNKHKQDDRGQFFTDNDYELFTAYIMRSTPR